VVFPEAPVIRFFESLGNSTLALFEGFGNLVLLAGRSLRFIGTGNIHWRNTSQQLSFIGVDSLPIALLISLSVGMVFTLQITNEFIKYGATTAIGGVVAISLAREMAPILVSVVVAGRVGSAIAAELGSMKVTEQIDALEVFAVDPVRYLVVPRILAAVLMLPVMVALGNIIGLAGGWVIATTLKGITSPLFLGSIQTFLSLEDVLKGMFKACIFGLVIALIGCHQGLNAKKGAQGVGAATTNAVVYAMIVIFVMNYFLSMALFPGGGVK
jgi:phospholipid/cholesterol/gamma-HCH transport system permease protein